MNIRKIHDAELREFCDRIGLVVMAAEAGRPESREITFAAETDEGRTVGCCRIDRFAETDTLCKLNYYLCRDYEYDEAAFSSMLFGVLRRMFDEFGIDRVACRPVKKMYQREMFFPSNGFVIEVLSGCVNPNGEYLAEMDYVMHREEFDKRYGN